MRKQRGHIPDERRGRAYVVVLLLCVLCTKIEHLKHLHTVPSLYMMVVGFWGVTHVVNVVDLSVS